MPFCGKNGGAAKINPPSCWTSNSSGYSNLKFTLKQPLDQSFAQVTDKNGHNTENCFTVTNVFDRKSISWLKNQEKNIQIIFFQNYLLLKLFR